MTTYLKRIALEAVRFLGLICVGIAWAAPTYAAVLFRHDPRVSLAPPVLSVLTVMDIPLLLATPILAVAGVVVVSFLTRTRARPDVASVMAVALVSAAPVFLYLAAFVNPAALPLSWDGTTLVLAVGAVIGSGYTVAVLWSVSRSAALIWIAVVASVVGILLFGGQRVLIDDPEQVAGMRVFAVWGATLGIIWVSALVAFLAQGIRLREQSPLA